MFYRSRLNLKPLSKSLQQKRTFFGLPADGVKAKELLEFEQEKIAHADKSFKLWKNLFLFSSVPVIGGVAVNAYMLEKEHAHHMEEHPIHYKDLPHLHIRRKPFPWGDGYKSLFHYEKVQPGPAEEH
ncbi:hypothetical protein MP638_007056 [Amoeboaphelidium occidentale]|nr:hypothetical protein MP638_007056 [Amoeboaphelidium occidentale]